jgi:hypothetical protein
VRRAADAQDPDRKDFVLSWSPGLNQVGNATINFSVSDGKTAAINKSVVVTVSPTSAPNLFQRPGNDAVYLGWAVPSNYKFGFKLERSPNDTSHFVVIATLGSGKTSYKDTTVAEDRTYYYRVKAYQGTLFGPVSNILSVQTSGLLPTITSIGPARGTGGSKITIYGTCFASADTVVMIDPQLNETSPTITSRSATRLVFMVPTNLPPGTRVYQVKVRDGGGLGDSNAKNLTYY